MISSLLIAPDDFIFSAWGKTTWGSDADKASLEADIAAVRGNFSDIPLIIGEWAASPVATETAARWRYFDFFLRTAAKYNTATVIWDNGADFLVSNFFFTLVVYLLISSRIEQHTSGAILHL